MHNSPLEKVTGVKNLKFNIEKCITCPLEGAAGVKNLNIAFDKCIQI
jgi:hypothetical protein